MVGSQGLTEVLAAPLPMALEELAGMVGHQTIQCLHHGVRQSTAAAAAVVPVGTPALVGTAGTTKAQGRLRLVQAVALGLAAVVAVAVVGLGFCVPRRNTLKRMQA